jgi:hypothetical protein
MGRGLRSYCTFVDDKFLLFHCLLANQIHARKPASDSLDLSREFGDGGSAFSIPLGRVSETVPAFLVVLLRVPKRVHVGFGDPLALLGGPNL